MDLSKNYFELFELEPQFAIDTVTLKPVYRHLQKQLHPDNFVTSSDSEKLLSVRWTSHVNEGLEVLTSPLKRALYLLELWGLEVDLEKNAAMAPEFLMQQMALRESLDDAEQASDPEAVLDKLLKKIRGEKNLLVDDLAAALLNQTSAKLQSAEEAVRKLAFLVKLEEQARKLEEKILD